MTSGAEPGMIVRPIEQLPQAYWTTLKPVLLTSNYDDCRGWNVAVWDCGLEAWFLGNEFDFAWWVEEGYRLTAVEDREAMYMYEPTHFAELPTMPPRQGLH